MTDVPAAPYLPTPDPTVFESTPLAEAGWYDNGQHGAPLGGLIARAIEAVPTLAPMEVARLTVELFRVVPIVPLRVTTRIVREGKKIQVVEASLLDPEGVELARAVGLRLRRADFDYPPSVTTAGLSVPLPEDADPPETDNFALGAPGRMVFHRHSLEVRQIEGGFDRLGPGGMWVRMVKPLVAGEPLTPLVRAVVTSDFVNGVSRMVYPEDFVFMNADLSVHLHRLPEGEWVGVDAVSHYGPGRGVATGVLFDRNGEVGRSTQSLFMAPTG